MFGGSLGARRARLLTESKAPVRLARFLAQAGVASRRRSETLIAEGAVEVNGAVVRVIGTRVEPTDRVTVAGKPVGPAQEKRYVVLHKPCGVMTTLRDPRGRRTVASLVPPEAGRVFPVGRLDYQTSGVILLTNDGDLAYLLAHPRYGVEKTYRATVRGRLARSDLAALRRGVRLDGGITAPAQVRLVHSGAVTSEVDVTIHEGRYRQVRRMLDATGHPVISLVRLRFGPLTLGRLAVGCWRNASARELDAFRALRWRFGGDARSRLEMGGGGRRVFGSASAAPNRRTAK